ncbi:translation elongation factor Ts [Candidatus Purcelliella pentastirinorum]|uniref:translation elongation factor Ts n=1 Tax=Candidatus Purcelliella pentastirinorum TaxID=472834 RepID=UPI00237B6518|nr:translation elongation factor Ts [Candidatus Purcelliella pentastirinorum]WDR80332.1 translation elongation factor Ts [Candidatus Purcelliella pentastirinorum]
MIKINSNLIKELRSLTGAGFLNCKRALIATSNNIEKSIDYLRKNDQCNAYNRRNNITKKGVIFTGINDNFAAIVEINSETDFVSRNIFFLDFANKIISFVLKKKITELSTLIDVFNDERNILISKLGENINIRKLSTLNGGVDITLGSYVHNMYLGCLVSLDKIDKEFSKHMAMHIVAYRPKYIYIKDIPVKLLDCERSVYLALAAKSCKSNKILKKYVDDKIKKFIENIVLTEQNFLLSSKKKVKNILLEKGIKIIDFVCFKVGE